MMVLIFNGPAEGGKGTVLGFLKDLFDVNVTYYSSIALSKEIARYGFGWNGKKDAKSRRLLSALKKLGIEYDDCPFKDLTTRIEMELNKEKKEGRGTGKEKNVFVTDIREPSEIGKIKEWCSRKSMSCKSVLVHSQEAAQKAMDSKLDEEGDLSWNKVLYDIQIDNEGTLGDLRESVFSIFEDYFNPIRMKPLVFSLETHSEVGEPIDFGETPKESKTVHVRWHDGYMEKFECSEVRSGNYRLWMRLTNGKERNIPLLSVRWFGQDPESHQETE